MLDSARRNDMIRLTTLLVGLFTCLAVVMWGGTPARAGDSEDATAATEGAVSLPAKDNLHLFLLMGQSNMVGRGKLTQLPPHPRVLVLNKALEWRRAVDPLHETSPRDRVGPGVSFGRALLQVVDENVAIGLVPCAVGGTPLERWEQGGDLYATALERARVAAKQGTLSGVLWLQGEKDASQMEWAETYSRRLDRMIADLRADLGQPRLPFVVGLPCEEILKREDRPGAKTVLEALRNLPHRVPHTACADSSGLRSTGDGVHFWTGHQREMGRRFAVAMAPLWGYQDIDIPRGYPWYRYHAAYVPAPCEPGLPNVLLIGDSISMQYTAVVREHLKGLANVCRPPANCRTTRQTLRYLDDYLGDHGWDVIHFNWGIHDITHVNEAGSVAPPPEGRPQVELDQYTANLRPLVGRLEQTGTHLIWASTTPIGRRAESKGYRRDADVVAYNTAAAEVMQAEDVTVNDLYALAKPRAEELLRDGVHFTNAGTAVLAKAVADSIRSALSNPRDEKARNASADFSPLARELLGASDAQLARLEDGRKSGLIEIAPVNLPVDPPGDCNHYGWPVATMVKETIVVMHRRIPGHNPRRAGGPHEKMSYGVVLRSSDGGETWSEPYDLRDCMKPEDRNRGGIVPLSHRAKFDKDNKSREGYKIHLHCIGTTGDGAVVAINNHGVFRSDDEGKTWNHFSTALRDDTFPHQIVNLGPRILDHPEHGLLAFGNWFGEVDQYHKLSDQLVVLRSRDGGATWQVEDYTAGFPQYEPAAIFHEGRVLFVTRDQTKVRAHKQMSWLPGEPPKVIGTNLQDPRYVDTVDFCLNPVTKRFEIVRSERYRMQLWLWSMAPEAWETGQWRRECRLLSHGGEFWTTGDGFHPAAAVIDEEGGVQHVFVYAGYANGPAGVFRITRPLDTSKLTAFLKQ